jgi:lysyl-tRNA synthetase, class II
MLEAFGFDPVRLQKRASLLSSGTNPYPYSFPAPTPVAAVIAAFVALEDEGESLATTVRAAGRIWAKRLMGRACFIDLRDATGKIQLYLTELEVGSESWQCLALLEEGDLIGVEGITFRTRTGELSVRVQHLVVLNKAVVPIPVGKEVGERVLYRLSDPEARYRERYLHWLLDARDRGRIQTRARIISAIRRWMESAGFLEVATPTIEPIYGGAEARPFTTCIWALGGQTAYLRISPELYLKRYLVAGFEKVFTICQNFRNEGIDRSHNPEFTMMEWYEAYTDYEVQMVRFETLVEQVCREVTGSTRVTYQGVDLDFSTPWRRISMLDAIREETGIAAGALSADALREELLRRKVDCPEPMTWGLAVTTLFEATCEARLIQPTFVLDHPIDTSPLTKVKRGDPRLVERFEPYVAGLELGNAYSELTDPVDQLERLLAQREMGRAEEDFAAHPVDVDFIRAMGCGMPPAGGVGLGVDRLIMLLTDAPTIRDIVPFPMVKSRIYHPEAAAEADGRPSV